MISRFVNNFDIKLISTFAEKQTQLPVRLLYVIIYVINTKLCLNATDICNMFCCLFSKGFQIIEPYFLKTF